MKATRYALRSKHAPDFVRITHPGLVWTPFTALAATYDTNTEAAMVAISLGLEAHVTVEAV